MFAKPLVSVLMALAAVSVFGQSFTYQGYLRKESAPANEAVDLEFTLWDAEAAGTQVGTAVTFADHPVSGGRFTCLLGFGADAFTGARRWLEISVEGTKLTPRIEITAAPYAQFAKTAPWSGITDKPNLLLNGVEAGGDLTGTLPNPTLRDNAVNSAKIANESVNTEDLANQSVTDAKIVNVQWARILNAPTSYPPNGPAGGDLTGTYPNPTLGPNSVGSAEISDGSITTAKISNYQVTDQKLALPLSLTAGGPDTTPLVAVNNSGSGPAVFANNTATGVGLQARGGLGIHAVTTATANGKAIFGENPGSGANSFGVHGKATGAFGRGVVGEATSTDGQVYGVYGTAAGPDGLGVYGFGRFGVYGQSTANNGYGVYGRATSPTGVTYGVFGQADSAAGFAGYFQGKTHVNGLLSKSGGAFKIDHPLDPANKYLYHSFVESPDMKNIYDGVVTTNEEGEAWVELPDWFEALNTDYRYQLTIIDENDFAQARIGRRLVNNRFLIKTSRPNVEVSWQVTGIRRDPWANANRIPVEADKPEEERGTYLNPEAEPNRGGGGVN